MGISLGGLIVGGAVALGGGGYAGFSVGYGIGAGIEGELRGAPEDPTAALLRQQNKIAERQIRQMKKNAVIELSQDMMNEATVAEVDRAAAFLTRTQTTRRRDAFRDLTGREAEHLNADPAPPIDIDPGFGEDVDDLDAFMASASSNLETHESSEMEAQSATAILNHLVDETA